MEERSLILVVMEKLRLTMNGEVNPRTLSKVDDWRFVADNIAHNDYIYVYYESEDGTGNWYFADNTKKDTEQLVSFP